MKVKIGDKIYDPENEPILLILDEKDKHNIANMLPEANLFCIFPDTMDEDEIREWMKPEIVKVPKTVLGTGFVYAPDIPDCFKNRPVHSQEEMKEMDAPLPPENEDEELCAHRCRTGKVRPYPSVVCSNCYPDQDYTHYSVRELVGKINELEDDGPLEAKENKISSKPVPEKCRRCCHLDHSGAFTKGGPRDICSWPGISDWVANWKKLPDNDDKWHWRHRIVKPDEGIPDWCPVKNGEDL